MEIKVGNVYRNRHDSKYTMTITKIDEENGFVYWTGAFGHRDIMELELFLDVLSHWKWEERR